MALICCSGVALAYDDEVVVSDLDFSVEKGDYLCVVGENGSGKTTLMKALLGLIKPVGGVIEFGDSLRRYEIGYLPQRTDIRRDFPASVREIVLSGTLNRKGLMPFYNAADRAKAEESMELLRLSELSERCFNELSGGQQQRVLLARAICAGSRLLLLDEPVAGLDPLAASDMYSAIRSLNERGMAIIMISHDLSGLAADASHVLHLHKKPLFFGNTGDYYNSGAFRSLSGRGDRE